MAAQAYAGIGLRLIPMEVPDILHEPEMLCREIKMADGRYLFFYTFKIMPSDATNTRAEEREQEIDQ